MAPIRYKAFNFIYLRPLVRTRFLGVIAKLHNPSYANYAKPQSGALSGLSHIVIETSTSNIVFYG